MHALGLKCIGCHTTYPLFPLYECEKCRGILDVYYDFEKPRESDIFLPITGEKRISLGEGNTSLLQSRNLAKRLGLKNLFLKCEFTNPTGSFKDRPVSIGISKAVEFGFTKVIAASSGNGAASVAAYAAHAGLEAIILVPEKTPIEKIKQTLAYGANVIRVKGPYSNCFTLAKQVGEKQNIFNLTTTFLNPYTVEGNKMVAYELFEQLNSSIPDVIYVPIGAGPLLAGIYKGYLELKHRHHFGKLPRMAGIQAEGNNPIASAFLYGKSSVSPVANPCTIAGGIADGLMGYEKDGMYTLQCINESKGFALDVSDSSMLEAQMWLARDEGIFVEPSAAASIAGVAKSLQENRIREDDYIVVLLTGHGLKDMGNVPVACEVPMIEYIDQLFELLRK
ncbi:threonine synthase [Cytobacillus depressus]|uniref:Threonine synthase n=1 Tax=Cytobacillus depressus TaxID=1602942 RepID=A0A6L3UZ32_9BACI|nr:threonine synthase [Cytobacillus depressus]KAB2329554.1 threonine synthase [Cytobacillus depressus]